LCLSLPVNKIKWEKRIITNNEDVIFVHRLSIKNGTVLVENIDKLYTSRSFTFFFLSSFFL